MENIQLRQLIRESIQEYIREVETSGNIAAQEAKIKACEEAITLREKKANLDGLDEAYHDMMDSTKLNELKKEIKELQKYKTKAEKVLEKMKAKAEGKVTKKVEDEGMEEGVVDEVNIDEYTSDPESGPQLEENKINENSAYNRIVRKMEAEISPETRAEANRLSSRGEMDYAMFWNELSNETKADIADLYIDAFDEGFDSFEEAMDNDPEFFYSLFNSLINMDDEDDDDYLNEAQMLHMQKLAGIISETEYKAKLEEAKKKKMTSAQKEKKEDIVKGMKKSKSFGKSKEEKAKMYATATKLATKKKAKSLKEEVQSLFEGEYSDWWAKADKELGLDFNDDIYSYVDSYDEPWQGKFAEEVVNIDASDYEDFKNQVKQIYDEINPF